LITSVAPINFLKGFLGEIERKMSQNAPNFIKIEIKISGNGQIVVGGTEEI
jgi:hypothetical protein